MWEGIRKDSHLWYRDEIIEIRQVKILFHTMILRMVADGDVVDVKSGEVGNIIS